MDIIASQFSGYRGRFAPSPTGELHWGSLFTAFASFLDARSQQGEWLLRIDDLDPLRSTQQSIDAILFALERFGLHWDGTIHYQSQQTERYLQALDELANNNYLYACACSRKQLKRYQNENPQTPDYPGFCRHKSISTNQPHALRVKTRTDPVELIDPLQGKQQHVLSDRCGDFIVMRKDQICAYQLASVVDDKTMGISHAVRGYDLLHASVQQRYLQQLLNYPTPIYIHVPIIVDGAQIKLSKQTGARPITHYPVTTTLYTLLKLLNQAPPDDLSDQSQATIIKWGIQHWNRNALSDCTRITAAYPASLTNIQSCTHEDSGR